MAVVTEALRSVAQMTGDLIRYTMRSGRWWLPAIVVILAATALLVAAVQVVVPTLVYALF